MDNTFYSDLIVWQITNSQLKPKISKITFWNSTMSGTDFVI